MKPTVALGAARHTDRYMCRQTDLYRQQTERQRDAGPPPHTPPHPHAHKTFLRWVGFGGLLGGFIEKGMVLRKLGWFVEGDLGEKGHYRGGLFGAVPVSFLRRSISGAAPKSLPGKSAQVLDSPPTRPDPMPPPYPTLPHPPSPTLPYPTLRGGGFGGVSEND